MLVLGTAGHVDHGKSALVKALTGIDPDRLREEKERGLTIDLGFAWLTLPSGRELSIVDVPGHERFIKNMLAGVGGIDLALLVVAADEGVMPQTREHLDIVDLLEIPEGLVALTKKDLVDEEWLELVRAEVEETLKGTVLEGAPIVALSSVTGEGLPDLVREIDALSAQATPKRDLGRPRLPIDRVFSIAGFGTVVTGTLIDGKLRIGQDVEIQPGDLKSRIRGLQSHKHKVEEANPGQRVAVNLAGIAVADLQRGQVLTTPGWLRPSDVVDARLRAVRGLPKALLHNAAVTFHVSSAEAAGRLRLLDRDTLEAGAEAWAQVKLDRPLAMAEGDRFIVRWQDHTVGGGRIVDCHPRRHKRFHLGTLAALATRAGGAAEERVLQLLEQTGPVEAGRLGEETGLPQEQALRAAANLLARGQATALGGAEEESDEIAPDSVLLSASDWERLGQRIREALASYHHQFPLREGMPKEELRSRFSGATASGRAQPRLSPRVFSLTLARLAREGVLAEEGGTVRLSQHASSLQGAQLASAEAFLRQLAANPYSPAMDSLPDLEVLSYLVERGDIVKVAEGIYFSSEAYKRMVAAVRAHLEAHGKITVAEARDLFDTSRKYALALMEHLDRERITRRIGDERVLR